MHSNRAMPATMWSLLRSAMEKYPYVVMTTEPALSSIPHGLFVYLNRATLATTWNLLGFVMVIAMW